MRVRLFLSLSTLLIQCFSLNVHASDLKEIFTLDQQFRRTQAKSPIYLKWGTPSVQDDSENDLGFQIHVFKTKENIGFVKAEISEEKESVFLRVISLENKAHAAELLTTLAGIYKVYQSKLSQKIKYLLHVCGHQDNNLIDASHQTGFNQKIAIFSLNELCLEKKISPHQVPLEQYAPKAQKSFVKTAPQKCIDKPQSNSLSKMSSHFEDVRSCSLFTGRTPFIVGQTYTDQKNNSIYLKYAEGIDLEAVMEVSTSQPGFKIFRSTQKDEIGYIVPNYLPELGEIRIGAVWIKENMRRRGYCLSAMRALMSLHLSKKTDFPQARLFTFYTTTDNGAMGRVAKTLNFRQRLPELDDIMALLFKSMFFTKEI